MRIRNPINETGHMFPESKKYRWISFLCRKMAYKPHDEQLQVQVELYEYEPSVTKSVATIRRPTKYKVSDTKVADLVGLRTYCLLQHYYPTLYKPLQECTNFEKDRANGINSNATDLLAMHIDSAYTPEDLKSDLQAMCLGNEPHHTISKTLVGSSSRVNGYSFSLCTTIIILILVAIYWIIIFTAIYMSLRVIPGCPGFCKA